MISDVMRTAEMAAMRGAWEQARRNFEWVVDTAPAYLPARLQLSSVLLQLDHYREARRHILATLNCAPDHPAAILEIARHLARFHEYGHLLDLLRKSSFASSADPGMLAEMAQIVSSGSGDQPLALNLIERSLQADAGQARSHYIRGVIQMFIGCPEEAEAEFETSIALAQDFAQAHWMLSLVRKWKPGDDHVERLTAVLARTEEGSTSQAYLGFALHNELHDLQRFDEAWRALDEACRIKERQEPYARDDVESLVSAIKGLCDAEFVTPVKRNDPFVPVFVIGMHRSGTTLLERILGGHSAVANGGESYAFTAQLRIATDHYIRGALDLQAVHRLKGADFDVIGRDFIAGSHWRTQGKPFLTEKLPLNFLNAGFIAKALPNARFLHMVRDPIDTCFSNLRTFFSRSAPHTFNQHCLAHYYARYHELMKHWRKVMPGRILDVSYDELVNDPERVTRTIFEFCGAPFEPDTLHVERPGGVVATASMAHARQGILRTRNAQWLPYQRHLKPLLNGLEASIH
jgi:tetratricopeptide (TPR) repeat protein